MSLKLATNFDNKIDLTALESKNLDAIKFRTDYFSAIDLNEVTTAVERNDSLKVVMDDGFFWPYPYSTIHSGATDAGLLTQTYFQNASLANNTLLSSVGYSFADYFKQFISETVAQEVFPLHFHNDKFAYFGVRNLLAQKNGIDIHCENAFLYQLEPTFRSWLQENVDIENSISLFVVLQKPESGGDLILFDECWDNFQMKLGETTYAERHDINGSLFTNRQKPRPERMNISFQLGEGVVFRAAQIWHAIDKIEGNSNRITIGCFIAKGNDGKYYFWA